MRLFIYMYAYDLCVSSIIHKCRILYPGNMIYVSSRVHKYSILYLCNMIQ